MHVDLTVEENLAYAAALRLPRLSNSWKLRRRVVQETLEMLQVRAVCMCGCTRAWCVYVCVRVHAACV